jgi:hypothetical protein
VTVGGSPTAKLRPDGRSVRDPWSGRASGVPPRMLVASVLGVGLILVLPAMAIASAQAPFQLTSLVALHAVLILWSGLRIAGIAGSGRPTVLTLFFWVYVYLWLGLAPFAQVSSGTFPLPHVFSQDTLTTSSSIILLGVLAFEIGQIWSRRPTRFQAVTRLLERDLTWQRLVVLTIFSLLLTPILIGQLGGVAAFFTSVQALLAATNELQINPRDLSTLGIYSALLSIPPLIALHGWLHLRRKGSLRAHPIAAPLILGLLLAINAIVNNPISQARSWFAVCAFSLIFASAWGSSRKWFPVVALLTVTVMVVIFPFAAYFRFTSIRPTISWQAITSQYSTSGDYDSYQQIAAGVDYVQVHGFATTGVLLGPALFWVPRSLWQDKPAETGIVLAQFEGYANTNLSAPLWIEMYLEGGYVFVFIVFVLLGVIWRRLDQRFVESRPWHGGVIRMTVPLLAVYQVFVLRGSLLTSTGRLVLLAVVPLLIGAHQVRGRLSKVRKSRAIGHATAMHHAP